MDKKTSEDKYVLKNRPMMEKLNRENQVFAKSNVVGLGIIFGVFSFVMSVLFFVFSGLFWGFFFLILGVILIVSFLLAV